MVCVRAASTLFPYTTLFRSRDTDRPAFMAGRIPALNKLVSRKIWPSVMEITLVGTKADTSPAWVSITGSAVNEPVWRSEEHTSELQSRENLVCRLLLEKNKS